MKLTALLQKFLRSAIFFKMVWFILFPVVLNAQKGRSLTERNDRTLEKIRLLNERASLLNRDSTNEALRFAHEAYLMSIQNDSRYWQAVSLLRLSEGYLYNDSYDQALQYAYNAMDIFTGLKDDSCIAETHSMLGWIFYDSENPNFSLDYHRTALNMFKKLHLDKKTAVSLNAVGLVFQMLGNNDSAFRYFSNSLLLARRNNMTQMISAVLNNLGICENTRGEYSKAISFFNQTYPEVAASKDELRISELLNQMAYSYLQLKDYAKTDSLLRRSRVLISQSPSNTRKEKLLDNLQTSALLYEVKGDYKKAYESLQEYTRISNEIVSRNKSEVIAAQHLKRETSKRENEIKILEAQKELRNFQIYALIAGVVLLTIISVLAYSRLKHKREREKEHEKMKHLLMQRELESTVQEKKDLSSKLDFKNSSLKDYALYVAHNNELVNGFLKELEKMSSGIDLREENRKDFKKLVRDFLQKFEQNQERQDFDLKAGEAQSDFMYNLLRRFPGLTENEQKLCTQIRLNLSSKEIASFNNISVKSVEMARYRLRKHFGLNQKEDLNEFIRSF